VETDRASAVLAPPVHPPAEDDPQIALAALARLRWLAVIGQVAATLVAAGPLGIKLPLVPIGIVIGFTAVSNAGLVMNRRWGWPRPPEWLVRAVLVEDVLALTALLYLTGGPRNPFSVLYLVHVAMAVIAIGVGWTWVIVALAATCYGLMFKWHVPLDLSVAPFWVEGSGHWLALVLVCVLIAVFIGRIETSLRQREIELREAREQAARSERLASLTTLAAGAAHELNTPLGTIAVVAKELEVAAGGDAVVREDAQLIRQEVDRCRVILQRMRVGIADAANRGSAAVSEVVEYLRGEVRPEEAKRLYVQGEREGVVAASARAVEQALLVLLRNAFDASPNGTGVTLAIARDDGWISFAVQDRGTGMTEEEVRRAGEPFYTTKEPGKGMGLGLFLVRLVAERCGGRFGLESKLGEGTTATLEVPAGKPVPAAKSGGDGADQPSNPAIVKTSES